jgi:hypothetical protein
LVTKDNEAVYVYVKYGKNVDGFGIVKMAARIVTQMTTHLLYRQFVLVTKDKIANHSGNIPTINMVNMVCMVCNGSCICKNTLKYVLIWYCSFFHLDICTSVIILMYFQVWHEYTTPVCVILPLVGITCTDLKSTG